MSHIEVAALAPDTPIPCTLHTRTHIIILELLLVLILILVVDVSLSRLLGGHTLAALHKSTQGGRTHDTPRLVSGLPLHTARDTRPSTTPRAPALPPPPRPRLRPRPLPRRPPRARPPPAQSGVWSTVSWWCTTSTPRGAGTRAVRQGRTARLCSTPTLTPVCCSHLVLHLRLVFLIAATYGTKEAAQLSQTGRQQDASGGRGWQHQRGWVFSQGACPTGHAPAARRRAHSDQHSAPRRLRPLADTTPGRAGRARRAGGKRPGPPLTVLRRLLKVCAPATAAVSSRPCCCGGGRTHAHGC